MTQEVAKPQSEKSVMPKTVKSWLTSDWFKSQVALSLPKHLTPDRFCRVALTALTRIPKLVDCTPESVIKCMMTCSELGIEPDGRRAHLIPFGKECTLIIDYKGLVELALRSGLYAGIHADVVCRGDRFEYDCGQVLAHKIDFQKPRGDMYAAYCIIKLKEEGAEPKCEVMTKEEIDSIRKRSKAATNGPWVSDYNEMAKKTVFRRASKWLRLSPEERDALDRDADAPPSNAALVIEAPIELPSSVPSGSPDEAAESEAGLAPENKAITGKLTPQEELEKLVTGAGYTFNDVQTYGKESGNIEDAFSLGSYADVPASVATRLLRNKVGLLDGIKRAKVIPV